MCIEAYDVVRREKEVPINISSMFGYFDNTVISKWYKYFLASNLLCSFISKCFHIFWGETPCSESNIFLAVSILLYISVSTSLLLFVECRGRVVKGMGHFDHVWSCGVREVVSSIPDRGNILGWVFHPTRRLARVSLIWTCLSFQILNLFRTLSSWGSVNYSRSATFLYDIEVASHIKKLPFRPYIYFSFLFFLSFLADSIICQVMLGWDFQSVFLIVILLHYS